MVPGDVSSHPDPMIGARIYDYVIRSKLAAGGMGAVYFATHARLPNIKKVVKILLPEYSQHPVIRQRFEREAEAASRLAHEHVVEIDGFGALPDGQLFLIMPFLDGKPLDAYIREHGRFTEHRTLHIVLQLCGALQHLHDAGMVHRDLKPGNVFIIPGKKKNPYFVKLIDLGIAKVDSDDGNVLTRTGIAMGTPAYMAPELFEDAGTATPLSDLYAVALIAWEMLTGCLPWGMHTAPVLYRKRLEERPYTPNDHELPLHWLVPLRAALSARPEDRPPSARALAVALASATPAIPPHVPSGAELLAELVPDFVRHVPPSEETVRSPSSIERIGPLLWPPRETLAAELSSLCDRASFAPAAEAPATAFARPPGARAVALPNRAAAPRRWEPLAALGACLVGGAVTFAVLRGGPEDTPRTGAALVPVTIEVPARTLTPVDASALGIPALAPPPVAPPSPSLVPAELAVETATIEPDRGEAPPPAPPPAPEIAPPAIDEPAIDEPAIDAPAIDDPVVAAPAPTPLRRASARSVPPAGELRSSRPHRPRTKAPEVERAARPFDPDAIGGEE